MFPLLAFQDPKLGTLLKRALKGVIRVQRRHVYLLRDPRCLSWPRKDVREDGGLANCGCQVLSHSTRVPSATYRTQDSEQLGNGTLIWTWGLVKES